MRTVPAHLIADGFLTELHGRAEVRLRQCTFPGLVDTPTDLTLRGTLDAGSARLGYDRAVVLRWLALLSVAVVPICGCAGVTEPKSCTASTSCGPGRVCVDGTCTRRPSSSGPDAGDDAGEGRLDATSPVDGAIPCGETTFRLSETQETSTVPPGVRYMDVKAWGAGGNDEGACPTPVGGLGGFTEAVFAVTPGDPLIIIVGKRGRAGDADPASIRRFGWGAWGGGGLSGVLRGPGPITEMDHDLALLIAGGGGSSAAAVCMPGGPGNHPSAGGQPTMLGQLGAPHDEIIGGGGGYFGGNGGDRDHAAAGGTGYVSPAARDSRILSAEPGAPAPPHADDPDYDGVAGTTETSGQVVVHYLCEPPPPLF